MADTAEVKLDDVKAAAAAEQAYAAAAQQVEVPKVEVAPAVAKAPAPQAAAKPVAAKPVTEPIAAPAVISKPVISKPVIGKPTARKVAAKPVAAKPAPQPKAAKPEAAMPKAAQPKAAKPKTIKTIKTKPAKAAPKPVAAKPAAKLKDTIMTKTKTTTEDFTAKVKDVFGEAQVRAKAAYEKGTALFGDAGEFTKGNVEAVVESGKILAAGLQDLGKGYVAESKGAFETLTADVKELTAVKSPADFFKLQGEILRRNFDAAVASGSKQSEALLKLTNDAFAPIGSRVSVAVEKAKKAA